LAIEQLPIEQMREVLQWLDEYQATINASAAVFRCWTRKKARRAMARAELTRGEIWLVDSEGTEGAPAVVLSVHIWIMSGP